MNEAIKSMLAKPGVHLVSNTDYEIHGQVCRVEVTEDGTCYQLNPQGERDGVLAADRWYDNAIVVVA